jgi:hypothetical protein
MDSVARSMLQTLVLYNLQTYPPTFQLINTFPRYNVYDTINGGRDSVENPARLFQDSIIYYILDSLPDVYYMDRAVYVNRTMGQDPPTLGVATFDGLNSSGEPYLFDERIRREKADMLTSAPIDLSAADDSIYFSFSFQAQGKAIDKPDNGDSLVLEFYNENTGSWGKVWGTDAVPLSDFEWEIIYVDPVFKSEAFQFRFRAYANPNGAFDPWHIDYLYLNDNRRKNDTVFKDLAFVYPPSSLLKDYQAMPWWHFKTDPNLYQANELDLDINNLFTDPLRVFNKIVVEDTVQNTTLYIHPGPASFFFLSGQTDTTIIYPLNFTFPQEYVDSSGILYGVCDVNFRPASIETKDFIRSNDTVYAKAILENYYAYDDGTAEAGYGINPATGSATTFMAVEFTQPIPDSVGGLQIYFLPQPNETSTKVSTFKDKRFEISVWSSLSPAGLIYRQNTRYNPQYTVNNGIATYWLDSLVAVGTTFYIGFRAISTSSLNVGYDINTNSRNRIFWSYDESQWNNPSASIPDGSLMLRPVFRKNAYGVGLNEHSPQPEEVEFYPNPVSQQLNIRMNSRETNIRKIEVFDIAGKQILSLSYQSQIDLTNLQPGIYIVKLTTGNKQVITKKIIKQAF